MKRMKILISLVVCLLLTHTTANAVIVVIGPTEVTVGQSSTYYVMYEYGVDNYSWNCSGHGVPSPSINYLTVTWQTAGTADIVLSVFYRNGNIDGAHVEVKVKAKPDENPPVEDEPEWDGRWWEHWPIPTRPIRNN